MQIHPTRAAVDVAMAGMVVLATGVVTREAAIVAWGGALVVGLAIARAVTHLSVARIRSAGFEMLWRNEPKSRVVARGETVELAAEIRNRDSRAARFVALRVVASPEVLVEVEPREGEVAAQGRLAATVRVTPLRVGRQGLHGLSLEVQGAPGLFEVPLTFANPLGLEVRPAPAGVARRSARGGRSRRSAEVGRAGAVAGDGDELRELREHRAGDPFKRIAWKASARRGVLLVREFEREEREVVWLVLDASVELWSGAPGRAPLDLAIDEVALVAQRHLARGDRVGLLIVAARVLAEVRPDRGPAQGARIDAALALAAGTLDHDRCDLDEAEVAQRVVEHMRPLDPEAAHRLSPTDLDRVARRADRVRARAVFGSSEIVGATPRDRTLRRYLAAFGLTAPPRQEPERPRTDPLLAEALARLARERPKPSVIFVWSPPAELGERPALEAALRARSRRVALHWIPMTQAHAAAPGASDVATAASEAVALRARVAEARGGRALAALGVRVERLRSGAPRRADPPEGNR
ncbi:MAG: DUF58 domain-containing protein [Polyangiaceae bacterium]|nr:DUF58 domain-containing protein [Polyangiaceae bacterium]